MSKIYSKYIANCEHVWYDSSNIVYSVCFDEGALKSLKIVFKGGRSYLYTDVDPMDYVFFRDSESNGKVFNTHIKRYNCLKQDDVNVDTLNELMKTYQQSEKSINLDLRIEFNNETGEFNLYKKDELIFSGVEGKISIINLFKSLGMSYIMTETEAHCMTINEFNNKQIL